MTEHSTFEIAVDAVALREEVKSKYREVATDPHGTYHFHTGRYLARRLSYDDKFVESLPDVAVEFFRRGCESVCTANAFERRARC